MEPMTEDKINDYIMGFPPKTKLVRILDACLKRTDLECLFNQNGWLDGDVMNAYIYVLRAAEHLSNRAGGQLQGLQNYLAIAAQMSDFNLGEKWQDLQVTTWTWEESIQNPIQTDGSSCGLWALKLMEEWTGDELAHAVTQNGITLFRKQLPNLLHDSVLNNLKGNPEYEQPDKNEDKDDVIMWDKNCPPPTELSLGKKVHNDTKPPSQMPKNRINKSELLSKLRKYILGVNDEDAMKEIWVQSTKPYPISISLKQLKDLLKDTSGIDSDCFNMAVRVNAQDEARLCMDTNYHIMDLEFCILIPYRMSGQYYILFVFNLDQRTVTLLDPIPSTDMHKIGTHHKYVFKLKEISFYLNIALQDAIEGWKDDVFLWRRITPCRLPTNHDSHMSGFLVLTFMRWWDGEEVVRANSTVGYALRNRAVVHMLSYKDNESGANIPQFIRDLVNILGVSVHRGVTDTSSGGVPTDAKERNRERHRRRYAEMDKEKKDEMLRKRHQIEANRARERLRYENMTPKQKRSKQALKDSRRNSLSKESIAMENPSWTPEVVHTPGPQAYIPTCDWHIPDFGGTPIYIQPTIEEMSGEVTPNMDVSNISRRKHVTPGERNALLGLRNEAFYANCKKHAVASSDENPSITMENVTETPTQSTILNFQTTPPMHESVQKHQTHSPANDDCNYVVASSDENPSMTMENGNYAIGEDEGVILEEDSEDEEGYMFAGQEDDVDEDVETDEIMLHPASGGNKCVSVRDYYCYKFQMRPGIFNPILHGKRLFQQFAVDTYIKIENSRLDYIWNHQDTIRADLYKGLMDSLHAGEGSADAIGKRTVLSTSFIGGPRDKRRRYMDAMALVRKYGKPDIFLTMTCNPNWDEIKHELYPGQTPQDRPDLVVRVFRAKLEELKDKLLQKDILGKVKSYVYVVEFQKRGLPHAHFLLIMEGRFKLTCPEQYDKLISAELPNKIKYPDLYKMVVKHMMHGPCGVLNPDCPCTKGRPACKNQYPRPFNAATLQGKDSYPLYRRREDGRKVMVRKELLDNRWVVPYNPHLLRHLNCHINVEACSSIKAVKYLFKYIYKGHDRASITVSEADKAYSNGDIDEIKQYRDARWVTPPEALWRIYGFELSKNSPPVMQLQLHLENCHMVSFKQGQDIQQVVNREGVEKSMLTEYFAANRLHEEARGILYRDFPEWYTWQKGKKGQDKCWKRRYVKKDGTPSKRIQVGRIVSAHPAEGDRYYLRVLLNHVTGATCYDDLKTVNGQLLGSFREAAERRGLIEGDNTLDDSLTESTLFEMPSSLRRLFATILVFCKPSDVRGLWDKHLDAMSEDYRRNEPSNVVVEQKVLIDIRNMLQSMGKDIKSFPLPDIDEEFDSATGVEREIFEESVIEPSEEDINLSDSLNTDQKAAYEKIMSAVCGDEGGVFFVDGPGGTGKTFLYRALLATVRGQKKIAVATATSGVAASIMPGGRTAHSRFKIPLSIDDGGYCTFTKQSGTAKLLQSASLIIWDEASMTKRQAVEALDNSMRDIMSHPDLPFGGKTVVFGGDFRQVLPVVRKGSRAQIIDASLRRSYLWDCMTHLNLKRNMRAHSDPWFAEYLLRIGDGKEEVNGDGEIRLPDEICVPCTGKKGSDLDKLIDNVFPSLGANMSDPNYITSRAILSTRNDCVDRVNLKMINRFQGQEMVYRSFDCAVDDPHNYYPPEFLNTYPYWSAPTFAEVEDQLPYHIAPKH
ncbi:hypothetical protein ACQ4PT_053753 [Festuca glaucescens]